MLSGLGVTFRTMIKPDGHGAVPARDAKTRRRALAASSPLKEENCTVCMLCAR